VIKKLENTEKVKQIFHGWQETLIWSCLEKIMGTVWVTATENPVSAAAVLGDFCFLAGRADEELLSGILLMIREEHNFMILVPQNRQWEWLIERSGCPAKKVVRYAIKKEPEVFDTEYLKKLAGGLPSQYSLAMIDDRLYAQCKNTPWSRDLVSQFPTCEMYQQFGIGVAVIKDGVIVSGASSYSRYKNGIEIEIDTKEEFRRKGLATVCGAKLILECLKRNLYPSWDAQNPWSVALAEKLGYHFDHEYTAYETAKILADSQHNKIL